MMPVSQFLQTTMETDNVSIMRFNEYNALEIDGSPGFGRELGPGARGDQKHVVANLPKGMGYDWSGIARQQVQSGPQTIAVFCLGLLFVFLVLVAQYESLSTPFVIMLAVPLALLGAIGAIYLRRLSELASQIVHSIMAGHPVPIPVTSSDIYAQIGYIMLIGLAAKNAILIVEFANQLREQGMEAVEAVAHAAATRLRPILMTSIAFILGIIPLAFAHGDGAQSRISLGTAVLGRHDRFDDHEFGNRSGALYRRHRADRRRRRARRPDARPGRCCLRPDRDLGRWTAAGRPAPATAP